MNEQDLNVSTEVTNESTQPAVHSNLDHEGSILDETLNEFDPQASTDDSIIESEINLDTFHARIKELEGEVKQAKESTARANAETYNAQKRMEQETEKSRKFVLQKFARELLEVLDNLERAIVSVQNDADADDAIMDGVKLTHKSLLSVLNKQGVEVEDPKGEKFNADLHEAVGIDPQAAPDMVGEVLQRGYSLNGRLLRPAMVRVGQ